MSDHQAVGGAAYVANSGPRGPVERAVACSTPHPDGEDVACVFPDGHVVHGDGLASLWLPTEEDTFARGVAAGRRWAIDTLRDRAETIAGYDDAYCHVAAFLEAMASEEAKHA